jgi:hypothetical protein
MLAAKVAFMSRNPLNIVGGFSNSNLLPQRINRLPNSSIIIKIYIFKNFNPSFYGGGPYLTTGAGPYAICTEVFIQIKKTNMIIMTAIKIKNIFSSFNLFFLDSFSNVNTILYLH